jgi:hypothetical protein
MTPNNFRVKSGLTVGTTISGGNTTITGFVNTTSTVNAASHTVGSAFIANATGITTTGFANVGTTLAVAGISTFSGNVVLGSVGVSSNGSFGTAGQVLHSNGTATYWAADDNSGTVTSIATANGLSGGTITTTGTLGVTTGSTLTVNTTGIHVNSALSITSLTLAGAASGITTLATGNTTVTGFANVTGTIQGGSSLTIAGAASGITTLAAGNTTITGFANVTTTLQVGTNTATFGTAAYIVSNGNVGIGTSSPGAKLDVRGNLAVGGADAGPNFIAFRGTTADGPGSYEHTFIGERIHTATESSELFLFKGNDPSASGPDRVRIGASEFRVDTYATALNGPFETVANSANLTTHFIVTNGGNVGIGNTAPGSKLVVAGAAALGNTTVTGFANVTSTIQGGSSLAIAGALSGVTTAAMGNTTITGFANVTSTIQGGSSLTIAGALSGVTTAAMGNTTITGFTNISGAANVAGDLIVTSETIGVRTRFLSGKASPAHTAGPLYIQYNSNDPVYISGGTGTSGLNITGYANVTSTLQVGGVSTFSGNVVLGSVGVSANGGFGTAGHVLHTNGTATYWAVDDNTTYDLVAVANTAVNAGLLRLTDSSSSNDTVTFTGAGTSNVSSNATHIIINSADQYLGTVTSIVAANGLNGGTITSTGTMSVLGGSTLTVNSTGAHVNSALSIASLALSGDLTVSGNLTVSGTRTYVNTTTLDVGDNIFTLNADLGAVAPSQDAGMEIMRGTSANVQFLWDETNDRWSTNGQPIAVSSLVAAGAASGITTLAAGNTTITGFANVTSTLQVGGISTFSGNVVLGSVGVSANGGFGTAGQVLHSNGTATYWAADDNSGGTVTSIATANGLSGGTITTSGTLGVTTGSTLTVNTTGIHVNSALAITSLQLAGALSGVTTAAMGNTTITGFANVTSTIQGGSSLTIAGALSGVTTAAMGNTTVTGFANVTSTLQVGGVATFAANANFDSGVLFVDGTNNRVGINTTAPQSRMQIFGSNAPETGDAASTETMFTLTRDGSATVWREGASFALGRWQTGGGSNPFSRLDINLKSVTDNSSLPNVTVMTLQDNGRVGIGTTTAGSALDVRGVITGGDGTIQTVVSYTASAGVTGTLTNHPYVFYANNAERMRIAANGFVGIGASSPGTSLEVAGGIRARGGAPGSGGVNNNGYAFNGNSGDTDGGMFSSADGQLEFYTDSTEKMRIVANGNIGIGTTSPGVYKLNVNGQSYFADTINLAAGSGGIISWTTGYSDGTTLTFQSPTSGSIALIANGTAGLFIKSNQNVGIGTTTPGYKLEVNGSFAATTKSFVIPHPTKPGMKLRYGSLEGPENGVYVRGRLRAGEKIIQLPDYWEGLVDQDTYTVNLTPIGKHQDLYVEHIASDHIVVGGENIDCFYTVFAERNDVEKLEVEF